jgi:hypothetical protein
MELFTTLNIFGMKSARAWGMFLFIFQDCRLEPFFKDFQGLENA